MGSLSMSVPNSASIGHGGSGATTSATTYVVVFFLFLLFLFWGNKVGFYAKINVSCFVLFLGVCLCFQHDLPTN